MFPENNVERCKRLFGRAAFGRLGRGEKCVGGFAHRRQHNDGRSISRGSSDLRDATSATARLYRWASKKWSRRPVRTKFPHTAPTWSLDSLL